MNLEGVFNHLVLPPKLPGGQDPHLDEEAQEFVTRLVAAVVTLDQATKEAYTEPLSKLIQSLRLCARLNRGCLDKDTLAAAFKDLGDAPLVLYVAEQNAALIIRQSSTVPKTVIFEAFEASPSSEDVLASENALVQAFPGRACAVSESCFHHEDFRSSLAEFLEKASMETLNRLTAKTRKAGVEITEARDTSDPAMITQLLMPLLESLGESLKVEKFQKRVRDDVNIEVQSKTGSTLPFRRHPFWLTLRVAVERHLILSMGYHSGRALYKSLMTVVLAQLMSSAVGQLKPELTLMLRAKLCRRLAKLEQEKAQLLGDNGIYECFLSCMGLWMEQTIQSVSNKVEVVWEHFKKQTTRHVAPLPAPQSVPADHLRLQLRQSGSFLQGLLRQPQEQRAHNSTFDPLHINDEVVKQVQKFTARYVKIARFEEDIRRRQFPRAFSAGPSSPTSPSTTEARRRNEAEEFVSTGFDPPSSHAAVDDDGNDKSSDRCIELAESICKYFETVGNAYESNPTQMSAFVLNVLHLWVLMDIAAVEACPLIREYHPIFTPELLDVVQLEQVEDFDRLSTIQRHLKHRVDASQAHSHDILSAENSASCFAAKYLVNSVEMQALYLEILQDSQQARKEKQHQWEAIDNDCEQLSQELAALSCLCTGEPGDRTKDDIKNCTKCFLRRQRRRLEIQVHEDFLPTHETKAAKILFELSMPRWYEAYRNVTFKIVYDLAWPVRINQPEPPLILRDFLPLAKYQKPRSVAGGVTLASPAKSFLQTHWRVVQVLRGSLREVLRPHGPEFDLYDIDNNVWIQAIDRNALTFQHFCGVYIPECLREQVLPAHPHPPAVAEGPSSYAVIANERQCPQRVSTYEFAAYQKLLAGTARRWMTMLVELGSSHLNFSDSETVRLFSQLALQAGPPGRGGLREAYRVFADDSFCFRLAEMIDQRLRAIKSNWREANLMELCIALSQRLLAFTSSYEVRELAKRSIDCARNATLQWITRLREELQNVKDGPAAERAAAYAFKSALLCRQTFAAISDELTAGELKAFCEASIALQEHMATGFERDPILKMMVMKDAKMDIRNIVRLSMQNNPLILESAILKCWSESGGSTDTTFSSWAATEGNEPWVVSRTTTKVEMTMGQSYSFSQTVHFNYVSGFLLVDGRPAGRLPERIRDSAEVKELFGDHTHLRTFPSGLGGMSHQLVGLHEGWQIHFGLRDDRVIVRAISKSAALEFIPRTVFFRETAYDLPVELLDTCVHFLNLSTGSLHIHRRPKIWALHKRNWVIDLRTRQCTRNGFKLGRLLCPYSGTAQLVAKLFNHFERPEFLKIFLSRRHKLCVDLSRFELSFHVNKNNRLEETKLGKEFDPNQDAGTLYGLMSKLVLRDIADWRRRTVIVPLGRSVCRICDPHVEVYMIPSNTNAYAKYEIDDVLGRLTCPPEPALLYTKAHLHALTSFPIPDRLTGRTGTEEAIHILESGMSQPWDPLGINPKSELEAVAALSPIREFYPEDKRSLQKVQWNPLLPVSIQHERLETLARDVLRKSRRLQPFSESTMNYEEVEVASHLRRRAEVRRSVYDAPSIQPSSRNPSIKNISSGIASNGKMQATLRAPSQSTGDSVYAARDYDVDSAVAMDVKRIVKATFMRPFHLSKTINLRAMLIGKQIIGGFQPDTAPTEGLAKLVEDPLMEQFGELVEFSRRSSSNRLYRLSFRLALLSFKPQSNLELLEVFVALARLDALKVLVPPPHPVFVDFDLMPPTVEHFEALIQSAWPSFVQAFERKSVKTETRDQHLIRCEEEGRRLAKWFIKQWPSASPSLEGFQSGTKLLDGADALNLVLEVWQRKLNNTELGLYIDEIQETLDKFVAEGNVMLQEPQSLPLAPTLPNRVTRTGPVIPSLPLELLNKTADTSNLVLPLGSAAAHIAHMQATPKPMPAAPRPELNELQRILAPFLKSQDQLRKVYGEDLLESMRAMRNGQALSYGQGPGVEQRPESASQMAYFIDQSRKGIAQYYKSVYEALAKGDKRSLWLQMANLWPGGKVTLLEQLRSTAESRFGAGMKEALIKFGIMNTELQWLERLRRYHLKNDRAKLMEALKNPGHQNWDPLQRPDWLLMELECDLFIRPEQVQVADAIISPLSDKNSVLQMNMGQGKTSCIVPMAMAILADTTQIARLVVPKALLLQSAQVVQSRIGGLVGREIRHIPFSRRTPSTDEILGLYRELHREIREESGVLLTTSDHMLSFKLSGLQRLVDSKVTEADTMIRFQETLTRYSRDVIDESDFTLAVKTQLIYPSGPQLSVDGAPYRWLIIQELLRLFEEHLSAIRQAFPLSVEVVPRSQLQAFPMAFLLRRDAEDEFHRLIIEEIVNNRTSFLRLLESGVPPEKVRRTIRQFLSEPDTKMQDKAGLKEVVDLFADHEAAEKTLLLLRGLILNRILLFCLKRRYNVQYGLHPTRDPMAVPFEAKGVPSESSEFGHPDVAIILTTLSFYYAGLTLAQFRQSLSSVLKADDAASAYDRWIHECDILPAGLRHWNVINCDDDGQVEELYTYLRLDRNVLNSYLNTWVFPLYAKQFGLKLSASAWDLPNFARPQRPALPGARSTGFSGTNDNKSLLPLTIHQDDLPSLVHTNAEVLSYLLQKRNRHYHCAAYYGTRMTEKQLLHKLTKERIMILIDSGAYILELGNQALVSEWLEINKTAKAGVFFGSDNRAWVLYRGVKKKKVPLVATPFADNLAECLVFLDEAHCRGTDLKLPQSARGALTLALGQTKDQTVQAAMRLRQLATTQSIAFFAGPEVNQSIIDACKLPRSGTIHSGHVVQWLLEQSCCANEHLANLHLAQGVDYCRRLDAQWRHDKFLTRDDQRMMLLNVIRQQERQTLHQQYSRVSDISVKGSPEDVIFPCLKGFMSTLASQRRSMAGKLSVSGMHSSALEEVEQEREVEFQVEEVRQVQKRKTFKPLTFSRLHPAFEEFVHKGRLVGDEGYVHAFTFLGTTSIGDKFTVKRTSSRFFVSKEFTRTVVLSKQGQNKHPDNFLRPVEWILWSSSSETALVIIPEEAELLIPIIRRAGPSCSVHLMTYAAPVTKSTLQNFNSLQYYNMPPLPHNYQFPNWFTVELGIFAGRLYVGHDDCALVARYLQMSEQVKDQVDGSAEEEGAFARNPVTFMSEWLALRRQSDIQQTPMGYILRGRIEALHPEHPFFTVNTTEPQGVMEAPLSTGKPREMDNDDDDDDSTDLDHDDDDIEEDWDDLGEEFGEGLGDGPGEDLGEDLGRESPVDG